MLIFDLCVLVFIQTDPLPKSKLKREPRTNKKVGDMMENDEEAAEEAEESDDLSDVGLPPGLVADLADAGVRTRADWDALPHVRLKWPRACGIPPEGADVEIVD